MSRQLLVDLSLSQLLSAPPAELPSMDTRKADRAWEETRPLENCVTFSRHLDCNFSENSLHRFTGLYSSISSWQGRSDRPGVLNHYFDRIWVLCGPEGYRLVCFQQSVEHFEILKVFPCGTSMQRQIQSVPHRPRTQVVWSQKASCICGHS